MPNEAISFSFEATHYNENKSPIAGYKIDRFSNSNNAYILVKKEYGWKKLTIGLVVFLFACIGIISSCIWLYHGIFPDGNSTKSENEGLWEERDSAAQIEHQDSLESNKESFSHEEIEYLKNNDVWVLSDMKYISKNLEDLYNDVNNKKFSIINNKWRKKIRNIEKCKELLKTAQSQHEDGSSSYSKDGTININKYIKKINAPGSSSGGGSTPGGGSSSGGGSSTKTIGPLTL